MEYEIFCPDCGTFVESGESRGAVVRGLECLECGAQFDFSEDEEELRDADAEFDFKRENGENIPYDDYQDLDDSN